MYFVCLKYLKKKKIWAAPCEILPFQLLRVEVGEETGNTVPVFPHNNQLELMAA